jgi:glutamate racemase
VADVRPIGVFDSGVGGLTVLHEIHRQLPHESTIYLGDTARCPYGPRPLPQVREFAFQIMRFFMERDVKLVVVACNTATAAALTDMRKAFPVPVVGVIRPGAEAGALASRNRKIGVVATEGTIASRSYFDNVKDINPVAEVWEQACPEWVDLVEAGHARSARIEPVLRRYLEPLKARGIDTLILGCTHYPLLRQPVEAVLGPEVTVVDSATTTAGATRLIVEVNRLDNEGNGTFHDLYSTSPSEHFAGIAERMFGAELPEVRTVSLD